MPIASNVKSDATIFSLNEYFITLCEVPFKSDSYDEVINIRALVVFRSRSNVRHSLLPAPYRTASRISHIGEHKSNPNEDHSKKTLKQLAGYAREVFGSQSDRRFVPGFTIRGPWNLEFHESYRAKHCGSKTRISLKSRSSVSLEDNRVSFIVC